MNVYRIQAYAVHPTCAGIARVQVFNVKANSKEDAETAVRNHIRSKGYIAILDKKKF